MEYLGGFAKKTQLLIDLIKICQKYEMQSDKILPLGYDQVNCCCYYHIFMIFHFFIFIRVKNKGALIFFGIELD